MKIVVTGGSASGKSSNAENILCKYAQKKLYLATMQPFGSEAKKRIKRHLEQRKGKGFETCECFKNLCSLNLKKEYDGILIECVSNLLANEMFSPENLKLTQDEIIKTVLNGIKHVCSLSENTVIVTNEIFSDGLQYESQTKEYIKLLGIINQKIFSFCDFAYESVCGILVPIKGDFFK